PTSGHDQMTALRCRRPIGGLLSNILKFCSSANLLEQLIGLLLCSLDLRRILGRCGVLVGVLLAFGRLRRYQDLFQVHRFGTLQLSSMHVVVVLRLLLRDFDITTYLAANDL